MAYRLHACGPNKTTVKAWTNVAGEGSLELLFEDLNIMTAALGVGVEFARVSLSLRPEGGLSVVVLSPASWTELWQQKVEGAVFVPGIELLKALHADLPDEVMGAEAGESFHQQVKDRTSGDQSKIEEDSEASRPSSSSDTPVEHTPAVGADCPLAVDVEEKSTMQPPSGGGSLELVLMAGLDLAGSGIREGGLRLAPLTENNCCLSTILRLIFSKQVQPKALAMYEHKLLEVDVSSVYELPCMSIVQEEQEIHMQAESINKGDCTAMARVGIVHDSLSASFKCCSPIGVSLWTSQKLSVRSLDVSDKSQISNRRANEAGLSLGAAAGHPGAGFQIMGNFKLARQSMHSKEYTTVEQVDAINGTDFYIMDKCQRRSTSSDILSYEAAYKPSLGLLTSLEEVGVSLEHGQPIDSAVGQTTTLHFNGKFMLEERGRHKYELLMKRRLGEMLVVEHKKKCILKRFQNKEEKSWFKRLTRQKISSSQIKLGEQEYKLVFFINHQLDLDLYESGRLLQKVRRLMDLKFADVISPAQEQPEGVQAEPIEE